MPSMMKAPHSKGMDCPMCDGGACKMAEGGGVKGVHEPLGEKAGGGNDARKSHAGLLTGGAHRDKDKPRLRDYNHMKIEAAKDHHKRVLGEMKSVPGPTSGRSGFAGGGEVERKPSKFNPAGIDSHKPEKGVHHADYAMNRPDKGQSRAGTFNQHGFEEEAKGVHRHKLSELKGMKDADRTNLADGGEVAEHDDADTELSHGLGKELMGAFESKDHKAVMSALEAAVLHCMNKGSDEDM